MAQRAALRVGLRRLALLSSPVKLEDSLTDEATAPINCAYAYLCCRHP